MEPIKATETKLVINSEDMTPELPYAFQFLGVTMLAIKRKDGAVDLYQVMEVEKG